MFSFFHLIVTGVWLGLSTGSSIPCNIPVPPSQDPWYTAPSGFETAEPGAVLRIRNAPGNLTSIIANSSAAYQLLYRTANTHSKPSWAVTTLFVPTSPTHDASSRKNLVSYQVAYDSVDVDWSPSYGLYNIYSTAVPGGFPPDGPIISQALGRGWFVTVPDYEGPLASFAEGPQASHAILDGLRASASLNDIIDSAEVQFAIWGYSGGGLASAWAVELQSKYAADVKLSGAAVGGIPASWDDLVNLTTGHLFAFLPISAAIGLTSQFPEANATLAAGMKTDGPYNITSFYAAATKNFQETLMLYAYQDIAEYFADGQSPFGAPYFQEIIQSQSNLGNNGKPMMPYFTFSSIQDQVVGISGVDSLVKKYCAEGANILFQRNTAGGHMAEITNSEGRVLAFLESVFSGTFSQAGCKVENVTVAIDATPDPQ